MLKGEVHVLPKMMEQRGGFPPLLGNYDLNVIGLYLETVLF